MKSSKKREGSDVSKKIKKRKHEDDTEVASANVEKENNHEETVPQSKQDKPKKCKKRQKGLYKQIAEQLEFYFGDANLRRSKYMTQLLQTDPWVPLEEFKKFNKIEMLTNNLESDKTIEQKLVKALKVKKSSLLEVSEDLTKVKRVTPLQLDKNTESCTIYVENIPPDVSHDSLKLQFQSYGDVEYVSIPKFKISGKAKGFAFIEFSSESSVAAVMKACGGNLQPDTSFNSEELLTIKSYNAEQSNQNMEQSERKDKLEEKGDILTVDKNSSPSPKRLKLDEEKSEESDKQIEMASLHGLRILTKQQWRRLRNQYLNEQRLKFSAAKKHMKAYNNTSHHQSQQQHQAPHHQPQQQVPHQQPQQNQEEPKAKIESGLLVKVSTEEQIGELKPVKSKVRELEPEVAYIDVKIGRTYFYVRFKTVEQSAAFVQHKVEGWSLCKLEGEEEKEYLKVIAKDQADKKTGKVSVPKKSKKSKWCEKFDQHRNNQIFFTD